MRLEEIKIWKFNLLDMAIAFVIVVFAMLLISNRTTSNAVEQVSGEGQNVSSKFSYVVEVKDVAITTGEMVREGDKLYDKASGTEMGTITKVDVDTAKGIFQNMDGKVEVKDIPERVDIRMTVEAEGRTANGEYIANNLIRILVGSFRALKTKYVMFSGTIIDAK